MSRGFDRSRHGDLCAVNRRQWWRRRRSRVRAWLRALNPLKLPDFGDMS